MLASGNMVLIANLELKEKLVAYYEFQSQINFGEEIFSKHLSEMNDYLNNKYVFTERVFTDLGILSRQKLKTTLPNWLFQLLKNWENIKMQRPNFGR